MYKLIMKSMYVLVCIVLSTSIANASIDETITALQKMADSVVEKKLSNGIPVLIYKRGLAPVFSGAVVVGAGGVDELPGHTGISHLLEHMAFKGTKFLGTKNPAKEQKLLEQLEALALQTDAANNFTEEEKAKWDSLMQELEAIWDRGAFDREYRQRGAVGLNATTTKELTTYFVSLPINHIEFWAWVESERILNPTMRQFYSERDVVMEERRMRYEDIPLNKAYEHLLGVSYMKHTYRNPVIGYVEDIDHLTASGTLAFQKRFYVSQNMAIGLAGDLDAEKVIPMLERYFGRIPTAPDPERPRFIEPEQLGERHSILHMDAQPDMLFGYHKPAYPDPQDAPLTVLQEVLTGSRVAPLQKELIEEKKVAASISVFEGPGSRFPNLVMFNIKPRSPNSNQKVLQEFDLALERFKKNGASHKQVEVAKRSLAMSFLKSLNSNSGVAKDLATLKLTYGDWQEVIKWFEQVLNVTPEDVQNAAKQFLVKNRRVVIQIEKGDK